MSANKIAINTSPIPLTEELLIKFGFINGTLGCIWVHEFETVMQGVFNGRWQVTILDNLPFNLPIDIYYVHQLQNVYYILTGNELKIIK